MKLRRSIFILLIFLSAISLQAQHKYLNITVQQADSLIKARANSEDFVVLDIRTPGEYENGHLENVILHNYLTRKGKREIFMLDKKKSYLIYCKTGVRSAALLKKMQKRRFHEVYNMLGGIKAWSTENLPLVYEKQ